MLFRSTGGHDQVPEDRFIGRRGVGDARDQFLGNDQQVHGRLRLDVAGRMLRIDEAPVDLTGREWLVLECLALNAGRVVSKERLQQAITGFDQALTPNAVEVYVSRVRAKVGDAAVIRTVRGLGYRLDEPSA